MAFVQIIEYSSTRIDEIRALVDEFQAGDDGTRAAVRGLACADRDRPNQYVTIVEFTSYEDAMKNSESPRTSQFAEQMAKLCDGPPTFRNLDVVDTWES